MAAEPRRQESVVHLASKLEHVAVLKRDWQRIRNGIAVCRPVSPWLEGAGWAAVGAGASGLFAGAGMSTASLPPWMLGTTWTAAIALLLIGLICQRAASAAKRRAGDEVEAIQREMDQIEAECDQQRSL